MVNVLSVLLDISSLLLLLVKRVETEVQATNVLKAVIFSVLPALVVLPTTAKYVKAVIMAERPTPVP